MRQQPDSLRTISSGVSWLTLILLLGGCTSAEGQKTSTASEPKRTRIALTTWDGTDHVLSIADTERILTQVKLGGRPVNLKAFSGSANDVLAVRDGDIVLINDRGVETLVRRSELPGSSAKSIVAGAVFGFDDQDSAIWRYDLELKKTSFLVEREEMRRILGFEPNCEKQTYLGGFAASSSGDRFAMTVPGDHLLYEASQDWVSMVYAFSIGEQRATRLGEGMPLFWLDDDRVVVWNIEPSKDSTAEKFVARIYSRSGEVLSEQVDVGSMAWDGSNLYIVRVDRDGYSKELDKPEVEIWDKDMKQKTGSFHLPASFSNEYSSNFIVLKG